jgi:hypothetical protein
MPGTVVLCPRSLVCILAPEALRRNRFARTDSDKNEAEAGRAALAIVSQSVRQLRCEASEKRVSEAAGRPVQTPTTADGSGRHSVHGAGLDAAQGRWMQIWGLRKGTLPP